MQPRWQTELLESVRVGLFDAIPVLTFEAGEGDSFFAYWPSNGESVQILIPSSVKSRQQLPSAEEAIFQAVESLMKRAPIAGRA